MASPSVGGVLADGVLSATLAVATSKRSPVRMAL